MNNELKADSGSVSKALQQTPCCTLPFVQLWNEDCMETLKRLPDGSVDLMLQDQPYGISNIEWDVKPNIPLMWLEWERVIKPSGVILFTSTQPFASELILSRAGFFRYEMIWSKQNKQGFFDANKRPLKAHENILVFSKAGHATYNPQKFKAERLTNNKTRVKKNTEYTGIYSSDANYKNNVLWQETGERYPTTLIEFSNWNGALFGNTDNATKHPTQKPLDLFRYLVKTYSNEGDTVFDGYSGSGTTAAACIKEKRHFIGSELNKEYYDLSVKRLTEMSMQTELF